MNSRVHLRSFVIWVFCFFLGMFWGEFTTNKWIIYSILSLMSSILSYIFWFYQKLGSSLFLLIASFFLGTTNIQTNKSLFYHQRYQQNTQAKKCTTSPKNQQREIIQNKQQSIKKLIKNKDIYKQLTKKKYWFEVIIEGAQKRFLGTISTTARLSRYSKTPRGIWKRIDGKILLKIKGKIQLERGDRLRLYMRLKPPRYYWDDGLRDRGEYLRRQGIILKGSSLATKVIILQRTSLHNPMIQLDQLRHHLAIWLTHSYPKEDSSALIKALLLGDKSGLTTELRLLFAKNGVSHLLAISGLHLAIVGSLIFFVLLRLFSLSTLILLHFNAKKIAALLSIPFLLFYTLISGASWSTCRAFIMISLFFIAIIINRHKELSILLATTALILTIIDPNSLFALSFQLSFLAVIVLGLSGYLIPSNGKKKHSFYQNSTITFWWRVKKLFRYIMTMFFASIVATLGTLPLVLSFSPYLPLHGAFINVIAIPIGGYLIVGSGLLSLAFLPFNQSLASFFIQISGHSSDLLLSILHWSASQESLILRLPPLYNFEILAYYLVFTAILLIRFSTKWMLYLITIACIILLMGHLQHYQQLHNKLTIHFIDVGQGDSAFIQFPNGQNMLIDSGGEPFLSYDVGKNVIVPYLRWMRISHLDFAVLTHPHPDHFGGFNALLKHYHPRQFWHNEQKSYLASFQTLQKTLIEQKITLRTFSHPTTIHLGEVQIKVIHPFPQQYEGKHYYWSLHANDNSLVLLLIYKQIKILFSGDIEHRGEELIMQHYKKMDINVLKVPHHGSKTSSSSQFLDYLKPEHAIFSLGRANSFGFPHKQVIQRYQKRKIQIWRTDQKGLITLSTDGIKLKFKTFH